MSLDINELVRAVKQAAVEAVRADSPMMMCHGTVTSVDPLQITVDQKKILGTVQLVLTDHVRDFYVTLSTAEAEERYRVHNALKLGEQVVLLRCDGGQKYIVLDRWEARA